MKGTNTIDFISLGCSKNLVDSEVLMGMFEAAGHHVTHDSPNPQGDVVVINTCGFIADAKEESINTILENVQRKAEGQISRIYVMGCLSERYLADLEAEIPEVDGWYGKFNYKELLHDLEASPSPSEKGDAKLQKTTGKLSIACSRTSSPMEECGEFCQRHLTTPPHYAYIKISEGCDRHCAYCAIPLITGHHQSRPMEEILDEVRFLVSKGVFEFQVIAQELTYYGVDLYHRRAIADLVERISDIPGVEWIRLHYAYPAHFPWELLDVMRRRQNVCNYLDIALQHISDHMLERMHRHVTKDETLELIRTIRERVPGIHLRTTLMVGFPGETEEDFEELLDFVRETRFERMGAFAYSEEDGTYSALHYKDDVPEEVKQQRLDRLMALQQEVSAEIQGAKVGTTMRVIIDRKEGNYYIGRTEYSSPEVDPEVLIPTDKRRLRTGCFYDVKITDADEFDLYGEVIQV